MTIVQEITNDERRIALDLIEGLVEELKEEVEDTSEMKKGIDLFRKIVEVVELIPSQSTEEMDAALLTILGWLTLKKEQKNDH